jgi:membrane fusion protein, multidrug efflux system
MRSERVNYVKVVQRVPVKIIFDPSEVDSQPLVATGISVIPEVKVK